jgi:hypothetical protein
MWNQLNYIIILSWNQTCFLNSVFLVLSSEIYSVMIVHESYFLIQILKFFGFRGWYRCLILGSCALHNSTQWKQQCQPKECWTVVSWNTALKQVALLSHIKSFSWMWLHIPVYVLYIPTTWGGGGDGKIEIWGQPGPQKSFQDPISKQDRHGGTCL